MKNVLLSGYNVFEKKQEFVNENKKSSFENIYWYPAKKPELFDFNKCKRLHRKKNVVIGWSRYWKITVLFFSYPNKYFDILVGIQ